MDTLSNKTKSGDFEFPTTTEDMEALDTWKPGNTIGGTFAKSLKADKAYRDDINKAYGREKDYYSNVLYVDTMRPIGQQLKDLK